MTDKQKERRAKLERKILNIFRETQEIPVVCDEGIGKNDIKRTLVINDEYPRPSINTIKRIVDDLFKRKVIECVNPEKTTGLKFRLTDDSVFLALLSDLQNAEPDDT